MNFKNASSVIVQAPIEHVTAPDIQPSTLPVRMHLAYSQAFRSLEIGDPTTPPLIQNMKILSISGLLIIQTVLESQEHLCCSTTLYSFFLVLNYHNSGI